jgi:RNA polymerase-binding transcription factor DksA
MTDQVDEGAARERLVRERDRVGELISALRSEGLDEEESAQSGDLTHYDQHPADQGSEMFEREKDLAILEALESDLAEIEAALARLDEGTYGIDEITGDRIDPERLDALPTARANIPRADIPRADIPQAEIPQAEIPQADVPPAGGS